MTLELESRRILSIDGGGLRGVMSADLLARLEGMLEGKLRDNFDFMIGTSTGAIIAAAVALGRSAESIRDLYIEEAFGIFKKRPFGSGLFRPKYSPAGLLRALNAEFGELRMQDAPGLMVPVYSLTNSKSDVLKSWSPRAQDLRIVDVLMATTAAPTFFPAHEIPGYGVCVDGGLVANNPSVLAIAEMYFHGGGEAMVDVMMKLAGHEMKIPRGCEVLSVGTGSSNSNFLESKGSGALGWARNFVRAFISADDGAVEYVSNRFAKVHRLNFENVPRGLSAIDNPRAVRELLLFGRLKILDAEIESVALEMELNIGDLEIR